MKMGTLKIVIMFILTHRRQKGPAADGTDAPQPQGLLCNPVMKVKRNMISFFIFPSHGAPVE
jgi:hypothetical protein